MKIYLRWNKYFGKNKLRRLYYLLNFLSFIVDSNEVDFIVLKIGLNMMYISNVKEMLKIFYVEIVVFV